MGIAVAFGVAGWVAIRVWRTRVWDPKDHDDHPLHLPAALCAEEIARGVGGAMKDAWDKKCSINEVKALARSYLVHPELMKPNQPGNRHAQILKIVADWAASHPSEIATASADTSWDTLTSPVEARRNHSETATEVQVTVPVVPHGTLSRAPLKRVEIIPRQPPKSK